MKVELKAVDNNTNWIKGNIGEYRFEAKHFDEGSVFGIDEGRVSKLYVWTGEQYNDDNVIISYDRGWDLEPQTPETQNVLDTLVDYLETLPKRFENELEFNL